MSRLRIAVAAIREIDKMLLIVRNEVVSTAEIGCMVLFLVLIGAGCGDNRSNDAATACAEDLAPESEKNHERLPSAYADPPVLPAGMEMEPYADQMYALTPEEHAYLQPTSPYELYCMAMDDYLRNGLYVKAKSLYLSALREQPQWIALEFDPVMQGLLNDGKYFEARNWADTLLEETLQEQFAAGVFEHLIKALSGQEQIELFAIYIPQVIKRLSSRNVIKIVGRALDEAIDQEQMGPFETIVEMFQRYGTQVPDHDRLINAKRVTLLMRIEREDEAMSLIINSGDRMFEHELRRMSVRLLDRFKAEGRSEEALDGFVRSMLARWKDNPDACNDVARWWMREARLRKDYDALLARFGEIVGTGVDPGIPLGALCSSYYEIRTHGTPEQQSICGSLVKAVSSMDGLKEDQERSYALMRLDEAFFSEDYAKILQLVEQGVPEKDEGWHEIVHNKISAHLALEEGRKEEAIERFRRHMDLVRSLDGDLVDPISKQTLHIDDVLGFNEKRIGDILLSMGRTGEAHDAYARARSHYLAAMESAAPESASYRQAVEALAQLPLDSD